MDEMNVGSIGHTDAKAPHTFVISKTAVEMKKNGRFPQIFAPIQRSMSLYTLAGERDISYQTL